MSQETVEEHVRATLEAVRKALSTEPRIDIAHHHLALTLDGEVLTMEGEMAGVAAKRLALERAAAVAGVRFIVDRLRVRPARRMTPAEIRDHLCHALLDEPVFRNCAVRCRHASDFELLREPIGAVGRIDVEVSEDVITLSGEVPSLAHKRLAGVFAWWVPGTRDVVDGLEVVPAEQDHEGEIADAVRISLEKDPLVDATGVGVAVRGTVVTLEGSVPSRVQREIAEADAWYVFGVDEVRNRLEVRA
jgi:osmotically-inducible protein OsmY